MMTSAPPGFVYRPEFISVAEETALLDELPRLSYGGVKMRGVLARRRVAHFGWLYGYESWRIEPGPALPDFLLPLRAHAGRLAGVTPESLAEVLVTEYPPGAGIGWHRDAPMFDVVVGVSLLSPCRFRFQRGKGAARETAAVTLEPRSGYLLAAAARSEWQHSIPPTRALRYSITFRTLRSERRREHAGVAATLARGAGPYAKRQPSSCRGSAGTMRSGRS